MKEGVKLTGDGRYFQQLPTKRERNEQRFNEWVDKAITIFFTDEKRRKTCVS